jgi:hypothetical protein
MEQTCKFSPASYVISSYAKEASRQNLTGTTPETSPEQSLLLGAIPGAHLRHWLAAADMTQAQLARLLNLDAGQVSRWCNDKAPLKGGYANRVIQVFQDRGVKVETPTSGTCAFLSTPMASLDTQGYCVVGLLLVTASMRSVERLLARRVARAMLVSPLPRW